VEGIKAVAPGLSLSKIIHDVGEEMGHQLKAGAHEVAAAIFTNSAFVMYPRRDGSVEEPQHGLPNEKEVEHGMSM
jgi:hypothetical protein